MVRKLLFAGLLLSACADKETDAVDETADSVASGDICDDPPVVTYSNFGEGFMTQNCQPCHASTATDRFGAPSDVTFDTEEEVIAQADRVLARATGEDPTMPPEGGLSLEEREKLEIWLACGD